MDSLGEANKVELENVQTSVSAQNIAAWYGFHKCRVNPPPGNIPAAQSR